MHPPVSNPRMSTDTALAPVPHHLRPPVPDPAQRPTQGDGKQTQARALHTLRLAVVVHLYYPEYWSDFARALVALPGNTDVFITTPIEKLEWVRKIVANDLPSSRVIGAPWSAFSSTSRSKTTTTS
jgi:hypothetical protein